MILGIAGIGAALIPALPGPVLRDGPRSEEIGAGAVSCGCGEKVLVFLVSSSSTGVFEGYRIDRAPRGSPVGADINDFSVEERRLERASFRLPPPAEDRLYPALRDEPAGGRKLWRGGERLEASLLSSRKGRRSEESGIRCTARARYYPPPFGGASHGMS